MDMTLRNLIELYPEAGDSAYQTCLHHTSEHDDDDDDDDDHHHHHHHGELVTVFLNF
jgi:hypothetical protein